MSPVPIPLCFNFASLSSNLNKFLLLCVLPTKQNEKFCYEGRGIYKKWLEKYQ